LGKNWQTLAALWAGALSCNKKNLEGRTQLAEPVECASGGSPLLLYEILHLLFFPPVRSHCVHYASRVEKNHQQFLRPRGCLTNPFRPLSLCFGVIGKIPGLISRNNFVKKSFVCIGHCENVLARCDSIFPLLRCQGVWNKTCTQLSLSQILSQNLKNYSLGDVQRFCYHS